MGGISDIRKACEVAGFKVRSVTMRYEEADQVFEFELPDEKHVFVRCGSGVAPEVVVEMAVAERDQANAPRLGLMSMPNLGPTLGPINSPSGIQKMITDEMVGAAPEVPSERVPFSSQASATLTEQEPSK